jgi:pectin methylesterase-like acyl-CoA thioesterase
VSTRLCCLLFIAGVLSADESPATVSLRVAPDGSGDYTSVQKAIDAAPAGGVIWIAPGAYREVLEITKNNLQLRGASGNATKTVIVFDKSAGTAGGTMKSATVNVRGDDFFAENLTFSNDFNTTHPQLPQGSQALALLVTGDRAVFRNMRFLGNQDTLYAANKSCSGPNGQPCAAARQYFSKCYIEATWISFLAMASHFSRIARSTAQSLREASSLRKANITRTRTAFLSLIVVN